MLSKPRFPNTHTRHLAAALSLALLAASACGTAFADAADAHIAPPQDTPYTGTITIHVDASDTAQGIFRAHETIPVQAGELTLLYPKWLPGNHSPTGQIEKLAGISFSANGKPLAWTRDEYDVYAFHVAIPPGVDRIEADYQFLSSRSPDQGRVVMTPAMLDLQWNFVTLYPAGHYSRQISFAPAVKLPQGWQFGTALEVQGHSGDVVAFKPVKLNMLVDSPLLAGRYFKRVDLDPGAAVPVRLDIVADSPKYLEATPQQLQAHRSLVVQARKLYGSRHYAHYDLLLWLSGQMSGNGLEHHQSSENGVPADYFTDWHGSAPTRDLLAHEYTHSWNGKFRRPADLWTPNFNVPMGDSLLWMYEGQTEYWGFVLAARSGLLSADEFKRDLAVVAATYDRNRPGFEWRNLQETTNDPVIAKRAPVPYTSWQMGVEYYSAGKLLWLAVDAKIRSLSGGRKSLDDFAKAFFSIDNGSLGPRTYTFADIVSGLDGVAKYDWAQFLRSRLDAHAPPLDGIEASGWKLVYTDQQNELLKTIQDKTGTVDATYSIGLTLGKDGAIEDVRWNGPAFKAGVGSGATLVAVNGQAYSAEALTDAIAAAKTDKAPIALLLKQQDEYSTAQVDYHGGLQYPHLVRIDGTPDYLSQIIKAR